MVRLRYALLLFLLVTVTSCSGSLAGDGKVLVWLGEGESPANKASNSVGQVAYLNSDSTQEKLLDVPANAAAVFPCGDGATSPDRRHFAFLVNIPQGGRDGGVLYQITGVGQPVEVGAAHALSCLGNGTFQYSPDSTLLAYIDYAEIPANGEYVSGVLRILNTDSQEELARFENVGAFHLGNEAAEFVQFFTNRNNQVDEIAVSLWANGSAHEIATLFADAGCRYTSARITPAGGKLAVLAGHRCSSGTQWQFYTLNRDGGELAVSLTGSQNGGFFPEVRTNNLMTGADDKNVLFTIPDGLVRYTVSIRTVSMSNLSADAVKVLVPRGVVMPRYTSRTFPVGENAAPMFSPNRRWWAVVVNDSSTLPALNVIDLAVPDATPLVIPAARNDVISALTFAPDSSSLYYIAGGRGGAENSLFRLNLANGNVTSIASGTYGTGVIAPDGSVLALNVWQKATDQRQTPYQNLVLVNPADGSIVATLFEGVEYNDNGGVRARRFAYPLGFHRS